MQPEIIIIVAYLKGTLGIGFKGDLPWKSIPEDMKHFKKQTVGHIVIMGRLTWDSISEKYRPLEDRINIVVSTTIQQKDLPANVLLCKNLEKAIILAKKIGAEFKKNIFIIGGAEIYKEAMKTGVANKILATIVHETLDADRFFPSLASKEWKLVSPGSPGVDEKSGIKIQFATFINIKNTYLSTAL